MRKNVRTCVVAMVLSLVVGISGCGAQQDTATTTEAVETEAAEDSTVAEEIETADKDIAEHLAKIKAASKAELQLNVEGETDLPGNFFLSFVYSRDLIMLDGKGNVVWSKHEEQPKKGVHTGLFDFKKHNVNGTTYYSYLDQNYEFDTFGLLGYAPGERVILDEDFNEVKRITTEASDVTEKGEGVDCHDFLMFDLDHYIISHYVKDNVKNIPGYPDGSNIVYSYLQEVKDGEVVWDWKSIDYPELYDLIETDAQSTANDFANEKVEAPDTLHFNAMCLDEEGNLLCSFRHLDAVLCLDRTKQEDQIKWILSGKGDEFGLTELQKVSGQHYVTLDGNELMLFNNNNRDAQTDIRTYVLDMENKQAALVDSLSFNNKFSKACGSVQKVGDSLYVIGWGWPTTDNECMSVIDASTGETLMSVTVDTLHKVTYRCTYFDEGL